MLEACSTDLGILVCKSCDENDKSVQIRADPWLILKELSGIRLTGASMKKVLSKDIPSNYYQHEVRSRFTASG